MSANQHSSRRARWWAGVLAVAAISLTACSTSTSDGASGVTGSNPESSAEFSEANPTDTSGPSGVGQTTDPSESAAASDTGGSSESVGGSSESAGSAAPPEQFDMQKHAFSFENYGDGDYQNLSTAEMVRMFGDVVCAGGKGDSCRLAPTAKAWMRATNKNMDGGHCEGMAALSLLMEQGEIDPSKFGASTASGLKLIGNNALQHEIAYWWATQSVPPTEGSQIKDKPSTIVETLRTWFAEPTDLGYTVGFYKRDKTDGHAVTPIALEDKGEGKVDIVIYDNNYPGERRRIAVDMVAETWSYNGATIPTDAEGAYDGDATTETLELTPTLARLEKQTCSFCDGEDDQSVGTKGAGRVVQIFSGDEAFEAGIRLKVTAVGGGPLKGLIERHPVGAGNEWNDNVPTTFSVPLLSPFEITIDGTGATNTATTDVVVLGNGFVSGIEALTIDPGQTDKFVVDPTARSISYSTANDESPTLFLGVDGKTDSYELSLGGVELGDKGGTIEARLDKAANKLVAKLAGSEKATVAFSLTRINDDGEESFDNDGLELETNESVIFEYGAWKGNGTEAQIGIDANGDDAADETLEFTDES